MGFFCPGSRILNRVTRARSSLDRVVERLDERVQCVAFRTPPNRSGPAIHTFCWPAGTALDADVYVCGLLGGSFIRMGEIKRPAINSQIGSKVAIGKPRAAIERSLPGEDGRAGEFHEHSSPPREARWKRISFLKPVDIGKGRIQLVPVYEPNSRITLDQINGVAPCEPIHMASAFEDKPVNAIT